jgi:hypothetical protein
MGNSMSISAEEAAIRVVIAGALVDNHDPGARGIDALLAMRQAEAIVRALRLAGFEIKRA